MASGDGSGSAMLLAADPTEHRTGNGNSALHDDEEDNSGIHDLDLPKVAVSRGSDSGFFRLFRRSQPSRSRRQKADQRPRIRRYNLLSRDKLKVPMRNSSGHYLSEQGQPLVDIGSDENNEDDDVTYYDSHTMRRLTNAEIRDQLLKDGYNLDDQQDADDLDLIPPRPIEERGFYCCNYYISCEIL
ncbi:hypothetical protein BOX15_Mlig028155g2 [Macrostomum lignano]|uniref:Uncharacterized protein n=2 Tax=Macrostomum lignano TaxID=282301 RepID=A0A267FRF3_9PLAT|nr:hypothetical protein BOX15_Mlig028155g2 [Macrostomum lignano]